MRKLIRVSDLIIKYFEKQNVKHIFLLPGGGNMFLVDAVAKSKKIEGIPFHHEHAVSIAAESYSRISDNIGVAIVTTGPGSSNAITGLLGSWIESIPLVIISGQVKTSDINSKINLRQQGVQGADIINIVKNITKYSVRLKKKDNFQKILNKAVNIAKSNRPGPVWIEVPLDIQSQLIADKKFKFYTKKNKNFIKNKKILQKIKNLIYKSRRPVFLVGHGVRLSGGVDTFLKTLKKLKLPTLLTWNAMDILEYDHPLNFGRPGVVAQRYSNFVVQNSDLVISIGCRIDNIITGFNEKNFAPKANKIIIDIDKKELKKFRFKNALKIQSDARIFLDKINSLNLKTNPKITEWIKKCMYWKKNYSYDSEKKINNNKLINHYYCVQKLSENLPKNIIISTGSSGLGIEVFYSIFKNKLGQRIFLTSGLGSMGYGLPSALGSSFANKGKPVFLIEGDGSLQQNIQELAVMKKFNLPITIIVLNNHGYCSIKNTQKNYFQKRFLGIDNKSKLFFPDLKKIASAYKIKYLNINTKRNFDNKLKFFLKNNYSPKIIDINLVSNETLKPKVSAIIKNGNIISMPLEDMSPLISLEKLKNEMFFKISKASILARKQK